MNAAIDQVSLNAELRLPWSAGNEEDRRFLCITGAALCLFCVVSVVVPMLPVSEVILEQPEQPPPHLARVLLEQQTLPEPEPVIPTPVQKPPVEPEVVPPEPVPQPQPAEVEQPEPVAPPVDPLEAARSQAAIAGVMAFQDDLAALRDSVDPATLSNNQVSRGQSQAAELQRSIISSAATTSSGGITTRALSQDAGGAAISGRQATRVESQIATAGKRQTDASQSAQLGGRSDESIRRVMDSNKGAIYAIYNRALRKDPLLAGKLMFEMVITASGEVTEIVLLSSELSDTGLTDKLLSRIRLIDFGVDNVISTRVNYSLDFLPYS